MLRNQFQFLYGEYNPDNFAFFDEEMRRVEACLFNRGNECDTFIFRNSEEEFQAYFCHRFSGHTFTQSLDLDRVGGLIESRDFHLTYCERPADVDYNLD